MLRLREIMSPDLVVLSPDSSIREAMCILAAHHVSGAPVVAGHRVLGVVSATDLLEFASSNPDLAAEEPREDDWNEERDEDLDAVNASFHATLQPMEEQDVLDTMNEQGQASGPLDWHTVSEVMTRQVRSLDASTPVDSAADFMRTAGIHRVLVTENEELVGIVSTTDIAHAVADRRLTTNRYVFGPPAPRR